MAGAAQEPPAPTGGHRRASAPVSSLQDGAGFNSMLNSLEGPTGWRSLYKQGNPFTGCFEEADVGEAARKSAAVFDCMSKLIARLQTKNTQFADRLISAEGVVVIWGVLTHPPQIIQKIMLKKIKLTLPICKRDYVTHSRDRVQRKFRFPVLSK
eukprot:SAG11_NODE_2700_length_3076_cov_20.676520_1_plen_153_part_10